MRNVLLFAASACVLFIAAACSDSPNASLDATPADAGPTDTGDDHPDAFVRDSGPPLDVGPQDGGFRDPAIILENIEEIAGLRTYVKLMGTATSTNPAVLFLHDGPELAHEYLPGLHRFLLDRLLVFYDMRATGRTSFGSTTMTTTLTADRHALDVADIVEWIGDHHDNARVDIIAHGYGGGVAALYAAANPTRVRNLILVTPYPTTVLQLANYRSEADSRLSSSEQALLNQIEREPECRGDINMCTIEMWRIRGPHFLCEENEDLFRDMTFMYGDYRTRAFVEFDLRDNTYNWQPLFPSINADTTIISGPCDPVPADTAESYAMGIRGARHIVVMNSGHFPMVEQTDTYQRAIVEALRR